MNWRLIWRGLKHSSMRSKILVILGILLVYRVLSHIPIPLAEPVIMEQLIDNLINNTEGVAALLSAYNVLSGGALTSLSIMLVGLGPYITASITMQVLTKAIPQLETLQKEGETGRKKINQYTRLLTLPLAIVQSIVLIFIFIKPVASQVSGLGDITANVGMLDWLLIVAALTTGAMILMWLGELITEKGLGNGISLLITVAIVSQLPHLFGSLFGQLGQFEPNVYDAAGQLTSGTQLEIFGWMLPLNANAFWTLAIILSITLCLTLLVVYLNEAYRKITVSYAKKVEGNRVYGDVNTFLPLKLIGAGVIPIIFALAFLTVPQMIGQFLTESSTSGLANFGQTLLTWFTAPGSDPSQPIFASLASYVYPAAYFLLVVAFTYFYTNVVFSAKDIAERLQRQGGFIEHVRPGPDTQKYLAAVVNRLNFFGSISLGFLALTPILAQAFLGFDQLALGGTSILILVAVALETLRQVESQALMVTYEDYEQNFTQKGEGDLKKSGKKPAKKRRGFLGLGK